MSRGVLVERALRAVGTPGRFAIVATVVFVVLAVISHPVGGLGVYYHDFREIIRAGFDPSVGQKGTPTFPMWGYGWLLLLTDHPWALLGIQWALGLAAVITLVAAARRYGYLSPPAASWTFLLLALALPWYLIHTVVYSAPSIGNSLFLLAVAAYLGGLPIEKGATARWMASAIAFGVALNVRSDYLYFAVVPPLLALRFDRRTPGRRVVRAVGWMSIVGLWLVPWATYTRAVTSHSLATSTNAGAVLFEGLGNWPGNPWGIAGMDADPVMRDEIVREFGRPLPAVLYDTDRFLKRRFRELITESPGAYVTKCLYAAATIVADGFYAGILDPDFRDRIRARYPSQPIVWIVTHDPAFVLETVRIRTLLTVFAEMESRVLLVLGLIAFAASIPRALRFESALVSIAVASVGYQLLVNIAAFHMRIYLNNGIVMMTMLSALLIVRRWSEGRGASAPVPAPVAS